MKRGMLQVGQSAGQSIRPGGTSSVGRALSASGSPSPAQTIYFDNLLRSAAFSQKSSLSFHALAHFFSCNYFIFTYLSKMPGVTTAFITPMASASFPATRQQTRRTILLAATSNHARGRGFTTGAGCRSVRAPSRRRSPQKSGCGPSLQSAKQVLSNEGA
jgi:hypothetical protein